MTTKTFVDCTRCGGEGKIIFSNLSGGVCFKCKGSGKQRKTQRVRVKSDYFLVENGSMSLKQTFKEEDKAIAFKAEFDAFWALSGDETTITPKSTYYYESLPV